MRAAEIKIVIVDDEPLARRRIVQLLKNEPDARILAECGDGLEAISAIRELQPDLLFLDVQMPEISGFDVLREVNTEKCAPAVIFVTAFDQHTIEAFDAHAVDYLLKPYAEERFRQAVARARARIETKPIAPFDEQLSLLLARLQSNESYLERIIVSHKDRLIVVLIRDIDWIETYGNYLKIHTAGKTYLLRETMNKLAEKINAKKFIRIHRSTLVNLDRIRELQPMFGGQYAVVLRDGTELTLSRNYRKPVLEIFGL